MSVRKLFASRNNQKRLFEKGTQKRVPFSISLILIYIQVDYITGMFSA